MAKLILWNLHENNPVKSGKHKKIYRGSQEENLFYSKEYIVSLIYHSHVVDAFIIIQIKEVHGIDKIS